jgi:hypothetical protein
MSDWSYLPNAEHIDRILAHLEAHPEKWSVRQTAAYCTVTAAWTAQREAVNAVWNAQRHDAWTAAFNAVWDTALGELWDAAWRNAASGAVLALISNDTCAYLLREKIERVELLAGLGIDEAILLLPAVRAMSDE